MPKPLPRVSHVESPFLLRAELLTLVPHSMATIDRLEAKGQFPKRIRLEPTNRVGWLRREVTAYLRHLAKRRQSAAQENHVKAANPEKKSPDRDLSPAQSERSGPTLVDQPANPDHQFAPALAQTWRPSRINKRKGCDDDQD
jgi:predicted DNA-binding transcriptional regulator AlpA